MDLARLPPFQQSTARQFIHDRSLSSYHLKDMGVPDIRGWKAIVTSSNYYLEEKRVKRDINRNIGNADIAKV